MTRRAQPDDEQRRVAHVVVNFGQLSQTFVRDAVWELDRLGWEAWVVSARVEHRELFAFPPGERLRQVSPRRPRPLLDRIRPRSRWERLSWKDEIAAAGPALVHAHMGPAALYGLPAARRLRLPLLASFHGRDLTVMPSEEPWAEAYPRLLARADRVTVVSRFLEAKLRALGFQRPAEILPAGVRLERFPRRPAPPPVEGGLRVLCIARQLPYKGVDVLLRALPRVLSAEPRVRLEVVGEGEERRANEELARELGVGRDVVFHGGQPEDEVARLLRDAHLLVAPSRTSPDGQAEGSPVVTKEALAIGVPAVSTVNGGLPETIPPRYRHELVPEGDAEALAARIVAVLRDRQSWPERAAVGREWVEQEFDWGRLARRTAAIYEEMTRERTRLRSGR